MVGVDTLLVLEHNKRAFTNYVGKNLTIIDHLPTIFDRVALLIQRRICILLTFLVQWNLDLRKILGVDKIFLKSRFFLISNTLKVTSKGKVCKMNT